MIVPASGIAEWTAALPLCPFGADCVVMKGRYLGTSLGAKSYALIPPNLPWTGPATAAIRVNTWAAPIAKLEQRVDAVSGVVSPGIRAIHWKIYIVTLVPYPSYLLPPESTEISRIMKAAQKLIPTRGWACWRVLPRKDSIWH